MTDDRPDDSPYTELPVHRAVLAHPILWEERAEEVSVLRMTNALLRHSRATIGFPIVVTLVVVVITLLLLVAIGVAGCPSRETANDARNQRSEVSEPIDQARALVERGV